MKTYNSITGYIAASLLLLLFTATGFSQKTLEKAQEMKANYDYAQAIVLYNDHFKTTPPKPDDARQLAECYMMMNDTRSSEEWLSKVVSSNSYNSEDLLNYANILKSQGKYKAAIAQYERYASLEPAQKEKAEEWISSCNKALEWIADPSYIDVENAAAFNSENSDFGLIPFGDGYILTSDRKIKGATYTADEIYGWTGNPYLKLYYQGGRSESKLSPVDKLNNNYHNGPETFNTADNIMYFTRTKMVKVTKKPLNSDPTSWYDHSKSADYTNRLEIYFARYDGSKWQDPEPFKYNNAEQYSIGHPALSSDGKILYFVSDMPGGYGGTDIYYSEKLSDGSWSTPKNAGNKINTEGKEVFPFVDKDGVLYFSSDGHEGMGGLDIFSSHGSEDQWNTPENLKYPVNSSKDDFSIYFTQTGQTGYFSSNRDGGKGEDDIYSFVPAPPTNLILVGITKARLEDNSIVTLNNVNIKMEDKTNNTEGTLYSDNEGTFSKKVDCGSAYNMTATKEGYFTSSKAVATSCKTRNDSLFVEFILDKIIINKPIVLDNIYYDYNKWNIRPDAATELEKLVKILKDNPMINIELGSHTDCRGTDEYNQKLSQHRAESAVTYIVSKGIDGKRITAKGYGESVLINRCKDGVNCSDEEHQMNRRTEFKVTSINK
jgi:outer membrane protein OmpA-like peptidoglycan-associated protein/tetratricopeptide (TPR) repeat protein